MEQHHAGAEDETKDSTEGYGFKVMEMVVLWWSGSNVEVTINTRKTDPAHFLMVE
jgi:hypothetical protein